MDTEITEAKELIELYILQQILDATKLAEVTFIDGIKTIEGIDGKKYKLDKIRERCNYLFDKIMEPYAI